MRKLVAPELELDADRVAAFARALGSGSAAEGEIKYDIPYPKHEFLTALVTRHEIVLHGSSNGEIGVFSPTLQTDYFGRSRRAVFAASDGIWPMFFAILNRSRYHGSLRNACYWEADELGRRHKCYAFSINAAFLKRRPWSRGWIHILPRATFERVVDEDGSPSEEWLSTRQVTPLARLAVSPADFPFLKEVEGHGDERTDRLEELVYQLGTGAEILSVQDDAVDVVFAPPALWRERVTEFVALLRGLMSDLRVEMHDEPVRLRLDIRGPGSNYDRLAVALQQWRQRISRA